MSNSPLCLNNSINVVIEDVLVGVSRDYMLLFPLEIMLATVPQADVIFLYNRHHQLPWLIV